MKMVHRDDTGSLKKRNSEMKEDALEPDIADEYP